MIRWFQTNRKLIALSIVIVLAAVVLVARRAIQRRHERSATFASQSDDAAKNLPAEAKLAAKSGDYGRAAQLMDALAEALQKSALRLNVETNHTDSAAISWQRRLLNRHAGIDSRAWRALGAIMRYKAGAVSAQQWPVECNRALNDASGADAPILALRLLRIGTDLKLSRDELMSMLKSAPEPVRAPFAEAVTRYYAPEIDNAPDMKEFFDRCLSSIRANEAAPRLAELEALEIRSASLRQANIEHASGKLSRREWVHAYEQTLSNANDATGILKGVLNTQSALLSDADLIGLISASVSEPVRFEAALQSLTRTETGARTVAEMVRTSDLVFPWIASMAGAAEGLRRVVDAMDARQGSDAANEMLANYHSLLPDTLLGRSAARMRVQREASFWGRNAIIEQLWRSHSQTPVAAALQDDFVRVALSRGDVERATKLIDDGQINEAEVAGESAEHIGAAYADLLARLAQTEAAKQWESDEIRRQLYPAMILASSLCSRGQNAVASHMLLRVLAKCGEGAPPHFTTGRQPIASEVPDPGDAQAVEEWNEYLFLRAGNELGILTLDNSQLSLKWRASTTPRTARLLLELARTARMQGDLDLEKNLAEKASSLLAAGRTPQEAAQAQQIVHSSGIDEETISHLLELVSEPNIKDPQHASSLITTAEQCRGETAVAVYLLAAETAQGAEASLARAAAMRLIEGRQGHLDEPSLKLLQALRRANRTLTPAYN